MSLFFNYFNIFYEYQSFIALFVSTLHLNASSFSSTSLQYTIFKQFSINVFFIIFRYSLVFDQSQFFCHNHFFLIIYLFFFDIFLNLFKHRINDYFILMRSSFLLQLNLHWKSIESFLFFITSFCRNFSSHFNQILHYFEISFKFI